MHLRGTMLIASLLMAGALFTACKQPSGQTTTNSNRAEKPEIVNQRNGVLEQAQQKRDAHLQQLKAMDVPHLAQQLSVDSQKTQQYFNTFGTPNDHWEDAAKAIIEEGRAAEEPLFAMLNDHRDAPVWGSELFMEYKRYKYRVSDYAWALLNE